jgi:membrane associated rhomboid family serine protease
MSMPSLPYELLLKPWTIITYMFYHEEFFHFLFNILNLYWFGTIFLMYFNEKQLVSIYLLGGIAGGIAYFLMYNLFPAVFPPAILMGASASIIAIMIAVAFYAPNFRINLLFIGEVKLIYIGVFSIIIFTIQISSGNPGGNLAHLGGAFFGYLWESQFKRGRDFISGFTQVLDSIFILFRRPKLKVSHKRPMDDYDYNKVKLSNQKEVDRILDKISKHGYERLTKEEKDILFRMGNKNN